MVATPSTMLELGTLAPPFDLPDMNNRAGASTVSQLDYINQPVIVTFICNHCPYVVLIATKLAEMALKWKQQGIRLVAVSSNDVEHYPADAPARMTEFAHQYQFDFPYLYDESQQVASAYKAACTPDFFLFNANHELVYRGQFDEARPGKSLPVTGTDLDNAVSALVNSRAIERDQTPSVGCSIKWKLGNKPGCS